MRKGFQWLWRQDFYSPVVKIIIFTTPSIKSVSVTIDVLILSSSKSQNAPNSNNWSFPGIECIYTLTHTHTRTYIYDVWCCSCTFDISNINFTNIYVYYIYIHAILIQDGCGNIDDNVSDTFLSQKCLLCYWMMVDKGGFRGGCTGRPPPPPPPLKFSEYDFLEQCCIKGLWYKILYYKSVFDIYHIWNIYAYFNVFQTYLYNTPPPPPPPPPPPAFQIFQSICATLKIRCIWLI